jgi:hypothetical protein
LPCFRIFFDSAFNPFLFQVTLSHSPPCSPWIWQFLVHNNCFFLTSTLYPGGIRSHDPLLQSPRWQEETLPVKPLAAFCPRPKKLPVSVFFRRRLDFGSTYFVHKSWKRAQLFLLWMFNSNPTRSFIAQFWHWVTECSVPSLGFTKSI